MTEPILSDWRPGCADDWNRRPLRLAHRLHLDPLFGVDALAALIERHPCEDYALVETSQGGDGSRRWREGRLGSVDGQRVIDAIRTGSLWLNLRDVGRHSPAHLGLIERVYAELAGRMPDFRPRSLKLGILISSPGAVVPYHCDLPGQALWQISGTKQVRVYPPMAPFLPTRALEDIAYSGFEFKLDHRPEFEDAAEVIELEPGTMLTWPLNSPHRIDNHACLNISVTTEHWTDANRRSQRVLLANGVLRHRLNWAPRSKSTAGPGYWAKTALQAAWRHTPWATGTQARHRPIEFDLDGDARLVDTGAGPTA